MTYRRVHPPVSVSPRRLAMAALLGLCGVVCIAVCMMAVAPSLAAAPPVAGAALAGGVEVPWASALGWPLAAVAAFVAAAAAHDEP